MPGNSAGIYSVLDDERLVGDFFQNMGGAIDAGFSSSLLTEFPSDGEVEYHTWLAPVGPMREWKGEAVGRQLDQFKGMVRNTDYENTLAIPKSDERRDKTGIIRSRIGELGMTVGWQPDILTSALITNGESATGASEDGFRDLTGRCYDNQAFFDTDHAESGSNQTNDLTATEVPSANVSNTSAPTATEMEGIITETIGHLYGLFDAQGQPANGNARNFQVQVGNARYWAAAVAAVNNLNLASGASNRLAGMIASGQINVRVVFNPRLSSSALKLYVFIEDGPVGPFGSQTEVAPQLQEEDPGITKKYFLVMANGTHAAFYALWHKAAVVLLS